MERGQDVAFHLKKVEQSVRTFSTLWNQRIDLLTDYFRKKKGFHFLIFNKLPAVQGRLDQAYNIMAVRLKLINHRETTVFGLIMRGMTETLDTLKAAQNDLIRLEAGAHGPVRCSEALRDQVTAIVSLIEHYQHVNAQHKKFLDAEKTLLDNPDDAGWKDYFERLRHLSYEFSEMIRMSAQLIEKKEEVQALQQDIQKLYEVSTRAHPNEHLLPSFVSSFFRVVLALGMSQIMADKNAPHYFTQLMVFSILFSSLLNFVDYYFGVFPKITKKTVALLKLATG
ncbi:MAG: hypothetical protein V1725_07990 [archaeon]